MNRLARRFALPLSFIAAVTTAAAHDIVTIQPSAQEWREDLHYLAEQMRLQHKSLFHDMTPFDFDQAVKHLDADFPHLNEDQIYVRFLQIGAMVQDGHTGFDTRPVPSPDRKDHVPVRFVRYPDGIYVRAAAPEFAGAVGGKLVRVGAVDWREAIQRLDTTESHDPSNPGEQISWSASTALNDPRILHGLGLSESAESADYVIEKGGQPRTFRMNASVPLGEWYLNSLPSNWIDARPASAPIPLSQQHEDKTYWFTYLPEHHAVYFQFNLVINGDEPLPVFAGRLAKALEQPGVQRLVIDLRNNTGGDNTLLRTLLVTLIRSKVNHRGGIFAIVGPKTFSAAQNFVNRLENYTEVIYVGQPTAQNVNFYGDPATITLPHSHLQVAVSKLWWQDDDPRDKRTATFPEVALDSTFQDYIAGSDPVLHYALTAPAPPTLADVLESSLSAGTDAVTARYQDYVNDPTHKFLPDPEAQVNRFGYKLLSAKRTQDAIVIFEVNARTHPNSWNAFDSLGEAYADALDKEHALAAYRKSLELNPANNGAKQMIERIQNAK
ncbi:MAG TPA: hypothetical protein VGL89_05065 [Candidatus Koribacter sp.]|jgi:hypothetical protein